MSAINGSVVLILAGIIVIAAWTILAGIADNYKKTKDEQENDK